MRLSKMKSWNLAGVESGAFRLVQRKNGTVNRRIQAGKTTRATNGNAVKRNGTPSIVNV